jgi:tetratricopeptide (TPR) repeat protein
MRCVAVVAAALAVCAVSEAPVRGDPKADAKAEKARADKLFDDGRKYLTSKEYALACTAFEQSQAADPAIGTQLNIALCYEEWGHVAAAYRAYVEAARVATAKKDDRAKGAQKKVDELGPQVPHLTLVVPTDVPAAIVLLDGQELPRDKLDDQLVEIGEHKIEGRVPGQPPKLSTIELKAGQHQRILIDLRPSDALADQTRPRLPPPAPPAPPRDHAKLYGGIALAGVGAAMIGVSAVVGLSARTDYSNAIGMCPMLQCTTQTAYQATQDARNRASRMTYVGAGGVALAAAGVVLIVLSGGHAAAATEPKTAVAPLVAPGVVGIAIGGRL